MFTEDCDGEIEITGLAPTAPIIEPALCQLVRERGVCGKVKDGGEEVVTHTFMTPELTTIVVENKVGQTWNGERERGEGLFVSRWVELGMEREREGERDGERERERERERRGFVCFFVLQSVKKCQVQLDCSRSIGTLHNRDSAVYIVELPPNTMKVTQQHAIQGTKHGNTLSPVPQ